MLCELFRSFFYSIFSDSGDLGEETHQAHRSLVGIAGLRATEDSLNLACGHGKRILHILHILYGIQLIQRTKEVPEALHRQLVRGGDNPAPRAQTLPADVLQLLLIGHIGGRLRLHIVVCVGLIIVLLILLHLDNRAAVHVTAAAAAAGAGLRQIVADLLGEPAVDTAEVEGVLTREHGGARGLGDSLHTDRAVHLDCVVLDVWRGRVQTLLGLPRSILFA